MTHPEEVVQQEQSDGRVFERFRRPPGTRLVFVSAEKKVLITKERRTETSNVDLRLPGGKVRDSLDAYHELLASGQDIVEAAKEAAIKEAVEETGFRVNAIRLLTKANAGATVEWDLYYFLVDEFDVNPGGQQLEHGEDIEVTWMSPPDIRIAIANGEMQEWRSVGVLLSLVLPGIETEL